MTREAKSLFSYSMMGSRMQIILISGQKEVGFPRRQVNAYPETTRQAYLDKPGYVGESDYN